MITQLDYRNVGEASSIAWSLFSIAEFLAMCIAFVTVCACALTMDVVFERAHQTVDINFTNRIMNGTDNGTQRLVDISLSAYALSILSRAERRR